MSFFVVTNNTAVDILTYVSHPMSNKFLGLLGQRLHVVVILTDIEKFPFQGNSPLPSMNEGTYLPKTFANTVYHQSSKILLIGKT